MNCFHVLQKDGGTVELCIESNQIISATAAAGTDLGHDMDYLWVLMCGFLVMFMQLGFTLLEAGAVRYKNTLNIMFKNFVDFSLGALVWYMWGFALTAAPDADWDSEYFGSGNAALSDSKDYKDWFFSMVFAATAATIVSGAVAERCTLQAYFIYSIFITGWIYPAVVYWVWSGSGFLSMGKEYQLIDFAGSGVVHMVGGFSGLMGAIMVGPRVGSRQPHSVAFQVMGVFILFFGWYGFNCGSTLAAQGYMDQAARVATTTTLSATTAGLMSVFLSWKIEGELSVERMGNGILAGLVGITAGCHVVEAWGAIIVGAIAAIIFFAASKTVLYMGIDDPLDAFAVHGAAGAWGVLACALLGTEDLIEATEYLINGEIQDFRFRLRNQVCGVLAIATWTCVFSGFCFGVMSYYGHLRVDDGLEESGLNVKHNSRGNGPWQFQSSFDLFPRRRTSRTAEQIGDTVTIELEKSRV